MSVISALYLEKFSLPIPNIGKHMYTYMVSQKNGRPFISEFCATYFLHLATKMCASHSSVQNLRLQRS